MCILARPVGLYTELMSTTRPSYPPELSCRCSSVAAGWALTARSDPPCSSSPGTSSSTVTTTPGKVITITTPTRSASSQRSPSMRLGITPKASPPPRCEAGQSWLLKSRRLGWRQWTRWRWWCWTPRNLEAVGWQAPGALAWSRISHPQMDVWLWGSSCPTWSTNFSKRSKTRKTAASCTLANGPRTDPVPTAQTSDPRRIRHLWFSAPELQRNSLTMSV